VDEGQRERFPLDRIAFNPGLRTAYRSAARWCGQFPRPQTPGRDRADALVTGWRAELPGQCDSRQNISRRSFCHQSRFVGISVDTENPPET
jgi:hypothetical protein